MTLWGECGWFLLGTATAAAGARLARLPVEGRSPLLEHLVSAAVLGFVAVVSDDALPAAGAHLKAVLWLLSCLCVTAGFGVVVRLRSRSAPPPGSTPELTGAG